MQWIPTLTDYDEQSRFNTHPDAYTAIPQWIGDISDGEDPRFPPSTKEDWIPDCTVEWASFFECKKLMERMLNDVNSGGKMFPAEEKLLTLPGIKEKLEGIIQGMNEIIQKNYDPDDYDVGQ
jgi:hypothetical protein